MLIAMCGGRMEVLGNYDGSDGLRVRDFPEIVSDDEQKTIEFVKVSALVVVCASISKARHQYFMFLCEEGCQYMKQYLKQKMRIFGEFHIFGRELGSHWKYNSHPFSLQKRQLKISPKRSFHPHRLFDGEDYVL